MKKIIICILFLTITLGCFAGCGAEKKKHAPILPPTRVGKNAMEITIYTPPLDELIETSNSAYIIIGDWLGEEGRYSFFEATVIDLVKGDLPEKIVVQQYGSSLEYKSGTTIFTYGNELFLFLKPIESEDYSNVYRIEGSYLMINDVAELDGVRYVLSRFLGFKYPIDNYADDQELRSSLTNVLLEKDSALGYPYYGIFLYDDFVNMISKGE